MTNSQPPPVKVPISLQNSPEQRAFFNAVSRSLYELWTSLGGQKDGIIPDDRLDISQKTTDDLSEGENNLYFTDERVDDRVNSLLQEGDDINLTYDDSANTLTISTSPFRPAESGVIEGLGISTSANGTDLDIAAGKALFSDYDNTPAVKVNYAATTITPGDNAQDLADVYSGWTAMTSADTIFFAVVAENGQVYQTSKSPLFGDIVRKYLTIGAYQIDNTTDRNIITLFPFVNINAKDYELSNVRTPTFLEPEACMVYGTALATTFQRSSGGVYFSGINFSSDPTSPNVKEFVAQDPMPFIAVFRDGSGGHVFSSQITDFADYVGVYDDGTPSATPLPNGTVTNPKFTVHYAFFEATIGAEFIQIGTNTYSSISDAIDAINSGTEAIDVATGILGTKNHYYIIMKGDASDFSDTDQVRFVRLNDGRFFPRA